MVRGYGPVVHKTHVRGEEEILPHQFPFFGHHLQGHVTGGQAFGFITVGQHLPRGRINFRMGGGGEALHFTAVVEPAAGLQGIGVQFMGQAVLLQGEQAAGVKEGVGIGRGAVPVRHRRVAGVRVAVHAV